MIRRTTETKDVKSGIGHARWLAMLVFLVLAFGLLFLTIVGVYWAEQAKPGKPSDRGLQSRSKGPRRL
jgi:hypothetical protein